MMPVVSVVIVSFNTKALLRECLRSLLAECEGSSSEIFVVDNLSRDDSAGMVTAEFPQVRLIRSDCNLGFAAANNRAFEIASGKYIVLLNSDAFLQPGALRRAVENMDGDSRIGLGGARLVGRDGSWQPSARLFPSLLNDFLTLSGLAARYPRSKFFGRFDRTWANQDVAAEVDWVPGAFSIIRAAVLHEVGFFDEDFFLYYEEVDLCRRIKKAGYAIRYWPDVTVTHLGGESSKTITTLAMSKSGSQLALWRMRSEFLYYRKHHGITAWFAKEVEEWWHRLRYWKNCSGANTTGKLKAQESRAAIAGVRQAWRDTAGGFVSPPRPW